MGQFLNIAKTILFQEKRPLRVKEIIEIAREKGYLDFSGGNTPDQTIKARISEDIKSKKELSDFKRVGKGLFALRSYEGIEYAAKPFAKKISQTEFVLVFRVQTLSQLGLFNGIKTSGFQKYLKVLLDKKSTFFMSRLQAEKDLDHKQILSYIIVEKNNKVLRFVRGVYTNAHTMLRGSLCIGFGGHVQQNDYNLFEQITNDNGYLNSVKRELLEELKIPESSLSKKNIETIGILNDDSSEVGKSHFAIIHKLNLDNVKLPNIKKLKGEKSINELEFVPINDLGNDFEKYEFWSKLCIKAFYKNYVDIDCRIHRVKNYSLNRHPRVITIVGSIGSGKTEASRILESNFGYQFLSTGRILQELMECPNIQEIGRTRFQDLAYNFISQASGPNALAKKILSEISSHGGTRFVIDGIRNHKTFEILKSALGTDLTLIFVESTSDNCYRFYKNREGDLDIYTFYHYINHPVEQDIRFILGRANIVVYNHGSLLSFQNQIKKFFKLELHDKE